MAEEFSAEKSKVTLHVGRIGDDPRARRILDAMRGTSPSAQAPTRISL
ncbi:hypothetical protein [Nitrospira calida]|jgi:hypothetical protein